VSIPANLLDRGPSPGRIAAVHGSVIDIAFAGGVLPAINEALAIEWDLGSPLIAEVQQHLGPGVVRAVALGGTAGLRRGTSARALGAPIRSPVGEAVLGRCSTPSVSPRTGVLHSLLMSGIGPYTPGRHRSNVRAAHAKSFTPALRSSICWRR
jgi:hypothetical protein